MAEHRGGGEKGTVNKDKIKPPQKFKLNVGLRSIRLRLQDFKRLAAKFLASFCTGAKGSGNCICSWGEGTFGPEEK